jgi:xanthosine utilization system XapX-like protein
MAKGKKLKKVSAIVGSFLGLAILILYLARTAVLTPAQAGLMVVALLGIYVGFGILIAVYRLINRLE